MNFFIDPRVKEFASGLGAAVISITTTYPATKLIYRQILENASLRNSLKIMEREGIKYLYRGIFPPLIQRCTELSLMFGVYKTAAVALQPLNLTSREQRYASSAIAGLVESVFTPFERVQMLLIESKFNRRFKNMPHVFYVIATEYGFKEYYRGGSIIVLRNVCHNVFYFTAKENLDYLMKQQTLIPKNMDNFLVGSFIGLSMTSIFYPVKVCKTNMQRDLGVEFKAILTTAKEIYRRDQGGVRNFYRGIGLNIGRAIISWGITNLSYEFLKCHI